jgi:CRISPR-associated protein Cas2
MICLLIYDIPDDRARAEVADICQDYGLQRIQYSAFAGTLARTHQEELMRKIQKRLKRLPAKVQLFVICERDWRARLEIIQDAPQVSVLLPNTQKGQS